MAAYAGYARSVVHAASSRRRRHELTLQPGHSVGADHKPYANGTLDEYLGSVVAGVSVFRLKDDGQGFFDEKVVASIESFAAYRNELIELFIVLGNLWATPVFDWRRAVAMIFCRWRWVLRRRRRLQGGFRLLRRHDAASCLRAR